jgi:uroporphyrinogen decarboxylase
MECMTSRERVYRVLEGKLPDRVPVLMQNFQSVAQLAGLALRDFCQSAELMAMAHLAAWERFGYDILDLENGTVALAEALGCEVEYPESEPPRLVAPAIRHVSEVHKLRCLDPTRDGSLPELLRATRLVVRHLRGRACVVGEADQGPFSLASMLVGMETFLIAVLKPSLQEDIQHLLEFCYEQVKRLALAQIDAGADFTQIGDSIAGPDVCSPEVYRRFAFPYEKRLAEQLAGKAVPLILHICGDAGPIIADMADTGASMLEIDHKVNGAECRRVTRERSVLVGNVDPSSVMALGSPEEVMEASRVAIRDMGCHGWFILSPGCTLPATTPAANIEAMMEAARRYGSYS